MVSGAWKSPDDVYLAVSSAFVSAADGEAIVNQLMSEKDEFQVWLPHFTLYVDEEEEVLVETDLSIEAWVANAEVEPRLDKYDSFGSRVAMERSRPAAWFVKELNLNSDDTFSSSWSDTDGDTVFISEAWGYSRGTGRNKSEELGQRLSCSWSKVEKYLQANNKSLLSLVKLRRYQSLNKDGEKFNHTMLAVLRNSDGSATISEVKSCVN